ncbi:MAG: glycerol-3-phosphate dehydrogenase [Rhodothermales bacterium]|jgi:glycerol-3-phosphate dehydrogenase
MLANAPHLVSLRRFIVPCKSWGEALFYGAGLKMYDVLAMGRGTPRSSLMGSKQVLAEQPGIRASAVRGGVAYYDGQFDDARFALSLAQTCAREGGTLLNYCEVESLIKDAGRVVGVRARDVEGDEVIEVEADCVINATGVFVDAIRRMDKPGSTDLVQASQGIHVVLDRSFLPGDSAVMVPKTDDGRVLFAIPWRNHVLLGTTDTPTETIDQEPAPLENEVEYLLEHAARYLERPPSASDVTSVFVGLRPLIGAKGGPTKSIPREHCIEVSESGLLTVTGGKWTTYRMMAQEVVDQAFGVIGKSRKACVTSDMKLHAWEAFDPSKEQPDFAEYGTERQALQQTIADETEGELPLHPDLPYVMGQVVWAIRSEMARTVEDVLARRTRALFLNARASVESAPAVAALLGRELGRDYQWQSAQVDAFSTLAEQYQVLSTPQCEHT